MEDLREIFDAFCAFGSNRNLATGEAGGNTMDGAKFAKFARDNKLIDNKKVTSTDVDIVFNKVKPKGARKIDWNGFIEGLTLVAEKKTGKQGRDALDAVIGLILKKGGGPIATGTAPKSDAIVDRLTDTSKYTGTHKLRFDDAGHGRGAAGRDRPTATADLSQITNREETSVRGLPVSIDPQERGASAKRSHSNLVTASSERLDREASKPKNTKVGSNTNLAGKPKTAGGGNAAAASSYGASSSKGGSVFDRLTDSSGYTGAHKQRFNADGTGKGLAGRDSPAKGGAPGKYRGGDVKDLAQILRS
ncbi:p25-alpha-domain-containing protein [Fimicolochytrium jonesii]|uniref:p25-alpha-domain-containing protein n=1 Tax=Fimicolochytrium jonesii TaxID=1396493 RepID=UPI0022FF3727|nr:p25-alpha-domain-containing protein [Fimicolochytrium jonesii]KAI8822048.1 p25-alpha-domain-containing protein [Fimicolochytrium jonesii]